MTRMIGKALGVFGLMLVAIAIIGFIGVLADGFNRTSRERDVCLKGAKGGLEIEECKR